MWKNIREMERLEDLPMEANTLTMHAAASKFSFLNYKQNIYHSHFPRRRKKIT